MSIAFMKVSSGVLMTAVLVLGLVDHAEAQAQSLESLLNSIPDRTVPAMGNPTVESPEIESPETSESEAEAAALMAGNAIVVDMSLTDAEGIGASVGTVRLENTRYGLLLTPDLAELPTGIHGFHIHQNPACGPGEKDGEVVPGLAAGGHFDPTETGAHEGPYGNGHLGDLPPLYVDEEGMATTSVLAPRLTIEDVGARALMIHMMGDNFSDQPAPLGGGGGRLACGVI